MGVPGSVCSAHRINGFGICKRTLGLREELGVRRSRAGVGEQ